MKILVYGIGGKMGHFVYNQVINNGDTLLCGIDKFADKSAFPCPVYDDCSSLTDKPDCIIDFSYKGAIYDYLPYAIKNNVPCVIATTGHDEKDNEYVKEASKTIPIFKSGNMSIGINLLIKLIKMAKVALGDNVDVEIVETHHRRKVDAPSGTALMLANAIKSVSEDTEYNIGRGIDSGKRKPNEIGVSSIRGGTVVGKHEVSFLLDNEVITIKHEAEDRRIFAEGSVNAAHFIVKKTNGLYDIMDF